MPMNDQELRTMVINLAADQARRVGEDCFREVNRLRCQLEEVERQQARLTVLLQKLIPDLNQKFEEMRNAEDKKLRDWADRIVEAYRSQHDNGPHER